MHSNSAWIAESGPTANGGIETLNAQRKSNLYHNSVITSGGVVLPSTIDRDEISVTMNRRMKNG